MSFLLERIAGFARDEPTRRALSEGDRHLDYGSLWSQANALAAQFVRSGLAPGERVALILPNSIEAVVATYATWLAGGVIVPLNAQAKARDFEPWLLHSGARIVVHEAAHPDAALAVQALAVQPLEIVVGEGTLPANALRWRDALAGDAPAAIIEIDEHALAMIVYTSGTTGQPKGVMLSHANLAANVESIVSYLGLTADDSIVSVLPFYYSYGASVLHTHLAVGAHLVIESNLVFPHLMVETMARERVTGFSGVPSTFVLLLNRVALEKYDLSSLRYVTQAGGAMTPTTTTRLRAALPQARVFIMYGQTEATARLAWLPPDRIEEKPGSVGVPIPGVEIEIRSENGQPAARFEVGDVYVRGANVMLGYWRDPDASAAVLQDGWLRTGDMGHLDADGFLFLSGRRSDMIKTGAHRVHPNDVEEVIAELPGIVEVAVIGVDDDTLGQVIKAFIVVDTNTEVAIDRVKAHCRERLAGYKIPKFIESVAALPKTASGKIRRAQLAGSIEQREVP
jgi:acyl-CoA synthetase (AMP-forming)/AMP-acid ligase II